MRDYKVQISEQEMAIKEWGKADGMPVIALHGWLDNAASFDNIAPALVDQRVLAVDLPGHGLSSHYLNGDYCIREYVNDVVALTEYLKLGRFALLGHSMGAMIVTLVAAKVPDLVSYVLLIDGLVPVVSPAESMYLQSTRAMSPKSSKIWLDKEQAILSRMDGLTKLSYRSAALLVERGTQLRADGSLSWRVDPNLKLNFPVPVGFSEVQIRMFLGQITAPVLLIAASQGILSKHFIKTWLTYIQRVDLVYLQGSHHLHMEVDTKDDVINALKGFMQSNDHLN